MKLKVIKNYKFILILYFLALIIFIIQHSTGLSWDFSAYVLNARYYLSGFTTYFEPLRPPLASMLLILLGAGTLFSEYVFIVFVSLIHLFSCYKLCKNHNLDLNIFYAVSLTPFFLSLGFLAGTELLSLTMIQLMIAYFYDKKAGLFLGLAALTRYTNISYFITLLFKRKLKPVIIALLIAALVVVPWLLFNWVKFGDPLFSMLDQYANNIGLRGYLWKAPSFLEFIEFFNYTLLLLPVGLFFVFKKPRKVSSIDLVMLFSLVFEIYSFIRIPLRSSRYLFVAVLPVSYFITRVLQARKTCLRTAPVVLLVLNLILLPLYSPYLSFISSDYYTPALERVGDCMVTSNAWVYVNYLGVSAEPYPHPDAISMRINDGYRVLLFKNVGEPEYTFDDLFISQFSVLENTSTHYLLGDWELCKDSYGYDLSYLQGMNRTYMEVHGYELSYTIFDLFK